MDDHLHRAGLRGRVLDPHPAQLATCPECRSPLAPARRRAADPGLRWLMAVIEQRCSACDWLHVRVDPGAAMDPGDRDPGSVAGLVDLADPGAAGPTSVTECGPG